MPGATLRQPAPGTAQAAAPPAGRTVAIVCVSEHRTVTNQMSGEGRRGGGYVRAER
jgi:hypothetical protein